MDLHRLMEAYAMEHAMSAGELPALRPERMVEAVRPAMFVGHSTLRDRPRTRRQVPELARDGVKDATSATAVAVRSTRRR
jgi:hypothetical protein